MNKKLRDGLLLLAFLVLVGFGVRDILDVNPNKALEERIAAEKKLNEPKLIETAQQYENGSPVLLVFLSTGCPHCQASSPTYKKILESPQVVSGKLNVVLLFIEGEEEVAKFLTMQKLHPAKVIPRANFAEFNVRSWPEQVLVRGQRVQKSWNGEFRASRYKDLLDFLKG